MQRDPAGKRKEKRGRDEKHGRVKKTVIDAA